MRTYILIAVLIYSCTPSVELSGRYASKQVPYSLTLNNDSTFSYRYKFEFDYEYSLGRWRKIGKNLVVLNSHYKEKTLHLKTEHNTGNSDSINLTIATPDFDRKYYECLIFINGSLHAKQKCDSTISISVRKPVENVFLGFTADLEVDPLLATRTLDTVYTEKFYPRSDTFDKYTLRIVYNDSMFNYRVFDKEIFKVTRKGLIFNDSKRKLKQTIPKNSP